MKTISTSTLVLVISASFVLTAFAQPSLGTTVLLEGPGAGSDSVVLAMAAPTDTWTAAANDAWLHLDVSNQSGTGSTNVVFSYDANPGTTRTGTLTIGGQTLTVTQAGSTYVAAPGPATALVASGLGGPASVAVDGAGNVYIVDTGNRAIKKWTAASNTVSTLVAPSNANSITGVAVDGAGNVYYTVGYPDGLMGGGPYQSLEKWTAASNTVSTLVVATNGSTFAGVAVDGVGNVYYTYDFYADTPDGPQYYCGLNKWTATNQTVSTLVVASYYADDFTGVAVDGAGNVYVADTYNNAIKEWSAANNIVTTLVSSGLNSPYGVAVDGAGNVCIADSGNYAIKKWTAANSTVSTLIASGLYWPYGVAVDGAGNIYIGDTDNNAVKELPHAFVDPTPRWEGPAAGSDVLPVVLPATANLLAPFAPTSDQAWLTITGITNGVVSFAFSANAGSTNRTANITLLGQPFAITQVAPPVITGQPASVTVCAESPAVFTAAAAGTNLVYQWQVSQDGGTTFTNISATATNASYTNMAPTLADNGNQYQVVVTGGGASATSSPPAVLTVNAPAMASAGANQTICAGSATAALGGTVGGGVTGGTWSSSGTGSFAPNATTLNTTYTPSAADITVGTVTLTLASTGQRAPCGAATAQVVVTIHALPAITGQPTNATVFVGSPAIFAVVATGVDLSYQWQVSADGGTTFTNISDTATNASYTNATTSLADDGHQYQVIVGGVCPSQTSTQAVLTVHAVEAWVGTSSAIYEPVICLNSQVPLSGALGLGTTGFKWVGAGTFYPSTTTLDVVYTPTDAQNSAGSATVTLMATNPAWTASQSSASVMVTIVRPATVSAGVNQTVCATSPQTQLEGSVGGTVNSEQLGGDLWWWYGAGDFLPDPGTTNAVYIPTAAEIAAGQATLTLAAYGPWPCWEVTSTMTITINPAATASAGPNQTICAGSLTAALGGTVGGGATGGLWTSSGTGTFVPDATTLNAIYTSSAADVTAGAVTLTMTSAGQQSPCGAASAQAVLTIIPVTLTPPTLIGPTWLSNGLFRFAFSNNDPCASFTVLTTTNPWLPLSNWTVAGPATNTAPGLFQFSTGTTNTRQGYYRVRSP